MVLKLPKILLIGIILTVVICSSPQTILGTVEKDSTICSMCDDYDSEDLAEEGLSDKIVTF